jgi:Tfp pilus assembly protein PilX
MNAMKKRIKIFGPHSEEGAALIIAVMILLILTVLGVYAITTSTLETKIAGNERVLKDAFYAADGGIDCGRMVIALFITQQNPTLPSHTSVNNDAYFRDEIEGAVAVSPLPYVNFDYQYTGSNTSATITVDRLGAEVPPGTSNPFGEPVAEKQTCIYYSLDSVSQGIAGASTEIQATYRYVLQ